MGWHNDLQLEITTCRAPNAVGARMRPSQIADFCDFLARKKGVWDPSQFQQKYGFKNSCAALCIGAGLIRIYNPNFRIDYFSQGAKWINLIKYHCDILYSLLQKPIGDRLQLNDINLEIIQNWLATQYGVRLLVHSFNGADFHKSVLLHSGPRNLNNTIHLLIYDNHCWLVTSHQLAFSNYIFCNQCELIHKKHTLCPNSKSCHLCHSHECLNLYGRTPERCVYCER